MKIGMIVASRPLDARSVMRDVGRLLVDWGVTVDFFSGDAGFRNLADVQPVDDVYVLTSGRAPALSLAGVLHAAGAITLNPYPRVALCKNKAVTTRVLQRAGLPVPETFVAARPMELARLLDEGPLVLKPHQGASDVGIHTAWEPGDLGGEKDNRFVLAQRYQPPDGPARRICCIEKQVFGTIRIPGVSIVNGTGGQPFTLTPELREIALKCGRALGLGVYGLDVITSNGHPFVVDVSAFPGFRGVPDAALRLADYIYAAARRVMAGGSLFETVGHHAPESIP